jgi:hypothetical protein
LTTGDTLNVDRHSVDWIHGCVVKTKSGKGVGQEGWVNARFVNIATVPDVKVVKPSYGVSSIWIAICLAVVAAVIWLFAR